MQIATERLLLLPATPQLLNAELQGNAVFQAALGFAVPDNWPPELYDEHAIRWLLKMFEQQPDMNAWPMYYVLDRTNEGVLAGTIGYKGPPASNGTVEIGYGLLEQFRGRGYATEGARALIERAFEDPSVHRVTAETYPHLSASINVMQRCGMTYGGETAEPGVIYFELLRTNYVRLWQNDS